MKNLPPDGLFTIPVPSRKLRDQIKSKLGSHLVFVVLNMDKDLQRERLEPRVEIFCEQFNEILMKIKHEPATDDEENAIALKITKDMLLDDVVKMIMETVK